MRSITTDPCSHHATRSSDSSPCCARPLSASARSASARLRRIAWSSGLPSFRSPTTARCLTRIPTSRSRAGRPPRGPSFTAMSSSCPTPRRRTTRCSTSSATGTARCGAAQLQEGSIAHRSVPAPHASRPRLPWPTGRSRRLPRRARAIARRDDVWVALPTRRRGLVASQTRERPHHHEDDGVARGPASSDRACGRPREQPTRSSCGTARPGDLPRRTAPRRRGDGARELLPTRWTPACAWRPRACLGPGWRSRCSPRARARPPRREVSWRGASARFWILRTGSGTLARHRDRVPRGLLAFSPPAVLSRLVAGSHGGTLHVHNPPDFLSPARSPAGAAGRPSSITTMTRPACCAPSSGGRRAWSRLLAWMRDQSARAAI